MEEGKFYKDKFFYIIVVLILGGYAYTASAYSHTNAYAEKLITAIVTNDRLRQQEDKELARDTRDKVDVINKEVRIRLDKIQEDITSIKITMAKIR